MNTKGTIKDIGVLSILGLEVAAIIIVLIIIGYKLDERLGTSPILTTAMSILGMVGCFARIIMYLKKRQPG